MPRVSTVLTTTNAKDAVLATVDSIMAQNCDEFEFLIVDDGSTDGTGLELLRRLGPNPARAEKVWWDSFREETGSRSVAMIRDGIIIHYLHNAQPRGRCASRNRALALARCDTLAFAEAGDIWSPRKLATQLRLLDAHPDCGASLEPRPRRRTRRNGAANRKVALDRIEFNELLGCSDLRLAGSVVRRPCIDGETPFDENLLQCEEYDFFLRIGTRFPLGRLTESLQTWGTNPPPDRSGLEPFRVYALEKSYQSGHLSPTLRHRVALELVEECRELVQVYRKQENRERANFYERKQNRIAQEVAKLELSDPYYSPDPAPAP